ncbi:MAG: hypothetical protein HOO96_13070, partial [Polyangiaceae bacterium]|nr:hypothetical protein [Polyangiaceae bacterium]
MKLSSFAVVLVSSLTSLLVACSSEEPTPEDTASLKAAICSGGGGGGDTCTDASGFCPPECSYCFQSATERIHLQNLWTCQD